VCGCVRVSTCYQVALWAWHIATRLDIISFNPWILNFNFGRRGDTNMRRVVTEFYFFQISTNKSKRILWVGYIRCTGRVTRVEWERMIIDYTGLPEHRTQHRGMEKFELSRAVWVGENHNNENLHGLVFLFRSDARVDFKSRSIISALGSPHAWIGITMKTIVVNVASPFDWHYNKFLIFTV
jgi:hypothetical protein